MCEFLKYKILITDKTNEEQPLLTQNGITILSRGNIACITGKAKSCKTFLVSSIISAFLEDETLTVKKGIRNGKVLYMDTEQSKSHVQNVQRRIYKMCRWSEYSCDERLLTLALRPASSEERRNTLEEAIKTYKPDIVVIDGIRDLIDDFNDIKSSSMLVKQLMRLSEIYRCGILTVLHQNKSDNNARGHLGTEIINKSETVLQINNINNKMVVSPDVSRNESIQPFAFIINNEGLPERSQMPTTKIDKEAIRKEVIKVMSSCKSMSRQAFISAYISKTNKKQSTAYIKLKQAIEAAVISENNGIIFLNPQ